MAGSSGQEHLVVIGGGMVAHRLVEALRDRDTAGRWRVTVVAEEPRAPYDRRALTRYFTEWDPRLLELGDPALWHDPLVTLLPDTAVGAIDRGHREVVTSDGRNIGYDALVLATGSYPNVPPIPGRDLRGAFLYRTLDDVAAVRGWVSDRARQQRRPLRGAVLGGGLLGLEAAGALHALGVSTTVVEPQPWLMPLQLDAAGGRVLRGLVEELGVAVRTSVRASALRGDNTGTLSRVVLDDGERIDVDVVVFAAGIRPRDELARECGLRVAPRGGVAVDAGCRTSDLLVWAVGDVASIGGSSVGRVSPGYAMAEVVADRLLGGSATFPGNDQATKLTVLGVEVACLGEREPREGDVVVVVDDAAAGTYRRLVLGPDGRTLRGGVLVGDTSAYPALRALVGRPLPADPLSYLHSGAGVGLPAVPHPGHGSRLGARPEPGRAARPARGTPSGLAAGR